MKLTTLLLSSLLVGIAGPGNVPRINGNLKYGPGQLVRLSAAGVGEKAALVWRVRPDKGVDRATTARGLLEFTAPPGTYEVELLVISGRTDPEPVVVEVRVNVEITANPPAPPPAKPNPAGAMGRLRFGNSLCTATVVGPRRADGRWDILTAAHCTPDVGALGTFTSQDGRAVAVRVSARAAGPDVCWLRTESDQLDDLAYAALALEEPAVGVRVWHAGFGSDQPGNREPGNVLAGPGGDGQTSFWLSVSPGDSGGGIFREDTGELVSAVCCTQGLARRAVMYGGSVGSIRAVRRQATGLIEPRLDEALGIDGALWLDLGRGDPRGGFRPGPCHPGAS